MSATIGYFVFLTAAFVLSAGLYLGLRAVKLI